MYYEIEKNVPMPKTRISRYNFGLMDVGDSFLVPFKDRNNVRTAASQFSRRNKLKSVFTVRKIDNDNCRCWRMK